MQISTININGEAVTIYDSGYVYPIEYSKPVNAKIIQTLSIPSSRYYYLSNAGYQIPYLALADSEQTKRDIAAWQDPFNKNIIYINGVEDATTPELDILKIIEGVKIKPPAEGAHYWEDFKDLLQSYAEVENYSDRFALIITNELIIEMMNYPFNPGADFIRASQLAVDGTNIQIDEYLQERGVVNFNSSTLNNLSGKDKFFYLTRFYGSPKIGDLNSKALVVEYVRRSTNAEAKEVAAELVNHISVYQRFSNEFEAYFEAILQNPNLETLWLNLGASTKERFYNSFFDYLRLLGRASSLPPLTLNTIRQLNVDHERSLINFLKQYRDQDIIDLVGNIEANTRRILLQKAADKLLRHKVFILRPYEAQLCKNSESVVMMDDFSELNYPFLGKGSLANGFDCYTLQELIDTFEANRSSTGNIVFKDPLNYEATFTVNDLTDFKNALEAGRGDIEVPPNVIDIFKNYLNEAELQASSDYQEILKLRQWTQEHSQNQQLMRKFWTSFFYVGMYMRQWQGPGYPYPVEAGQTGTEARRGTATEIEITQNISQETVEMNKYMDQMPENIRELIRELGTVRRFQDHVEPHGHTIYNLYTEAITDGVYCIRMASGPWAYTGAYYLKQILNENIPGFDLGTNVEYIQ